MKQKGLPAAASAQAGQALIVLLVAAAVTLSVLTAATLASIGQGKASARNELGRKAYYAAEAGAEYALIKLMRDPDPAGCPGTDTLTVGNANVTITYNLTGGNCQITSKATQSNVIKTIQLQAAYNTNQIFNYSGWVEAATP